MVEKKTPLIYVRIIVSHNKFHNQFIRISVFSVTFLITLKNSFNVVSIQKKQMYSGTFYIYTNNMYLHMCASWMRDLCQQEIHNTVFSRFSLQIVQREKTKKKVRPKSNVNRTNWLYALQNTVLKRTTIHFKFQLISCFLSCFVQKLPIK